MTPNRELLELAAKAAGFDLPSKDDADEIGRQYDYNLGLWVRFPWGWGWFRPHIDDGESFRLAVKLNMDVCVSSHHDAVSVWFSSQEGATFVRERLGDGRYAATRLTIVRAAAEIGRNMP